MSSFYTLVKLTLLVLTLNVAISAAKLNFKKKPGNETDSSNNKEGTGKRRGKLFSLFNVVTFDNLPCTSTSSSRNGTCFTSTECADKSGTSSGSCAAGFGVCCLFTLDGTGTTTITQNCTYIQNSGFPSTITASTTTSFTVNKCSADVCYLRLDFDTFTLLGTNGSDNNDEGTCTDTFTVTTPTAMTVPTICGSNAGQHIYVDIGAASTDTATIAIATTATSSTRTWDIKVTQVECTNPSAPRDSCCLQYHTGLTGRLTSFNYLNTNDNHLNNQQYSICIRQECGHCCVEYSVCPDQLTTIPGGAPAGFSFDTTRADSRSDNGCATNTNSFDFIGIQSSGSNCSPMGGECDRGVNSRYCGRYLNMVTELSTSIPICDCTPPFTVDVYFNSNSDASASAGNPNTKQSRGFCLEYRQKKC